MIHEAYSRLARGIGRRERPHGEDQDGVRVLGQVFQKVPRLLVNELRVVDCKQARSANCKLSTPNDRRALTHVFLATKVVICWFLCDSLLDIVRCIQ